MDCTIDVDFDVYKAITAKRANSAETANDVLRSLLRLPRADHAHDRSRGERRPFITGSVIIPAGTELRIRHRGEHSYARIEGGAIATEEGRFTSPSRAARAILGYDTNGWFAWECRNPGTGAWIKIDSLRRR